MTRRRSAAPRLIRPAGEITEPSVLGRTYPELERRLAALPTRRGGSFRESVLADLMTEAEGERAVESIVRLGLGLDFRELAPTAEDRRHAEARGIDLGEIAAQAVAFAVGCLAIGVWLGQTGNASIPGGPANGVR